MQSLNEVDDSSACTLRRRLIRRKKYELWTRFVQWLNDPEYLDYVDLALYPCGKRDALPCWTHHLRDSETKAQGLFVHAILHCNLPLITALLRVWDKTIFRWSALSNVDLEHCAMFLSNSRRPTSLPVQRMLKWLLDFDWQEEKLDVSQKETLALSFACWAHNSLVALAMVRFLDKPTVLMYLDTAASYDNWEYIHAAQHLYGKNLAENSSFGHVFQSNASPNVMRLLALLHENRPGHNQPQKFSSSIDSS
jgi:hypothetical protein